jgi:5-formyltetrahydrofolate cyclo-ligase
MSKNALPSRKSEYRSRALKARMALPDAARLAAGEVIMDSLNSLLTRQQARNIAGYAAIRGEVDCFPLLADLRGQGYRTGLPVVIAGAREALLFRQFDDEETLVAGPFGIPEPDKTRQEMTPDILLVPLVGFDRTCHRIGYGAGFYDRTIAAYTKAGLPLLTIGLAFECQKFDKLDVEGHDQPLNYIITEAALYQPAI